MVKSCMRAAGIVALAILPCGCLTYAAAGVGAVAAGSAIGIATSGSKADPSAVRVRMSSPRDLVLVGRDTVTVRDVQSLTGRLLAEGDHALTIAVSETDGLTGRQTFSHSASRTVTLARSNTAEMAVLSSNPRRKQRAVLGGILAGVAFVFGTLIAMGGGT
jgi:hypothetical protein